MRRVRLGVGRRRPRGASARGGRRRSRASRRAPPTAPGPRPSAAPRRGSCRGGSRRWAGCPRSTRGMGRDDYRRVGRRGPDVRFRGGRRPVRSTPMSYAVRTPVFEGPFDLLLHLILKQEVELWEVSLAEIVDAYLAELDRMDALDLDVATEFLLIAATLVELKARRLLPGLEDARARRGAAALRGARPPARPAARVQDVQGRRRARSRRASAAPTAACPAAPAPRSRTAGWRPTRSSGCGPTRCAPPRCACSRRRPVVSSTPTTSRPVRASVRDAVESVLRLLPESRAHELPGAGRRACRPARGDRALPRGARALQAGHGRPRCSSRTSASCSCAASQDGETALDVASLDDWDDERRPTDEIARREPECASRRDREPKCADAERDRARTEARARHRSRRAGGDRAGRAAPARAARRAAGRPGRGAVRRARARVRGDRARVRARAGRRRLPLPDPSRPRAVRRALRARGPARAPVGPGARDARDHRLQAADLARPDLGDPRRQRRGDAHHAAAARLRAGGRPRPRARARGALRHHRARSSSGSASTRSTTSRRSATSCPTRRWSRRSSAGCASATTRRADEPATSTPTRAPTPTAD